MKTQRERETANEKGANEKRKTSVRNNARETRVNKQRVRKCEWAKVNASEWAMQVNETPESREK